MTLLLKKDTKFLWKKLLDEPILQYPDFSNSFILTTDACNVGVGGVLSQMKNNEDLPVAYYSRTLSNAETRYSTTEKELLAVINSVEHFRPYLYGKKITIFTDHRPLQWLFNCKNPSSKLLRWRLRLEEYEYEVKYKPGHRTNAALIFRFAANCKTNTEKRSLGPLSGQEVDIALNKLLKIAQMQSFAVEIEKIKRTKLCSKNRLVNLNPFIDNDGFLRVGGRPCNAKYEFEKRHSFILSKSHTLTKLLVRYYHLKLMHAGPQHLLASLREKYWIISGRCLTKQVVRESVQCFRYTPKTTMPIMGNLPTQRLQPTHPFDIVGVDYTGPLTLKSRTGRGAKIITKCYVSLFVCF